MGRKKLRRNDRSKRSLSAKPEALAPTGLWGRLSSARKSVIGLLGLALLGAVTNLFTGIFTNGFQAVVDRVTPPSLRATASPNSGAEPLTVSAELHDPGHICDGGDGWVFPAGSRVMAPPITPPTTDAAARSGGVPASGNYAVLTIQGSSESAVVLTGLRIAILARRSPVVGDYPYVVGQCGGFSARRFVADLDRQPVEVKAVSGYDATGATIPAVSFPFKVSNTDPEQFFVRVYTGACDCDWAIDLDWIAAGKPGSSHITDHGKPFRSTGLASAKGYELNFSTHSWDAKACVGCLGGPPYDGPPELKSRG